MVQSKCILEMRNHINIKILTEYKCHYGIIYSIYIPINNFLLSCLYEPKIEVFNISKGNLGIPIKFTKPNEYVTSLILLNYRTFASSSLSVYIKYFGYIKIWALKEDQTFKCFKSVEYNYSSQCFKPVEYNYSSCRLLFCLLENDFMISMEYDQNEFKFWDLNEFKCMESFKETSVIKKMLVTKNNTIIKDLNFFIPE